MNTTPTSYGCFTVLLCVLLAATPGRAEPPEPLDPEERAPEGSLPGVYPESVTAANVNISPLPGSVLDGNNSNNLKVTFPAAGPIRWTESRHNEGDVALLIGPFDPDDNSYAVISSESPYYVRVAEYSVKDLVENTRDDLLKVEPTPTPERDADES